MKRIYQKGFTLIELLIVIAILGILAAGVLVAIDPVDKINAANDAKVQSDIGVQASASEAYAAAHSGFYPASAADLSTAGELKTTPVAPTGYTYTFVSAPASCTAGTTCTSVVITSTLKSKKYTGVSTPFQRYESSTGKTCQVLTATTVCP
jgi:prepilin-type N-terminal cleavage/methylation domain-containing protein